MVLHQLYSGKYLHINIIPLVLCSKLNRYHVTSFQIVFAKCTYKTHIINNLQQVLKKLTHQY